ncbi:hypothetical protein IHE45_16G076400 [Dioscorea alata]|uniref:Uncharacterized protein n=2 Tax=Dioscorea alata TaxID=55571 RepID=A0ACB7UIA6_DIOAL|nr:hypothetical protein IHE45_16G076400 [Dioscorea alata]KAH7660092.1 hypothetical protein IHE45_16G076400 [Dioscorea alata]
MWASMTWINLWIRDSLATIQTDENESYAHQVHHDQIQETALSLAHNRTDEMWIDLQL